jgi:hypothetical protein
MGAGRRVLGEASPSGVALPSRPMNLLILGGTAFLGPEIVDAAK